MRSGETTRHVAGRARVRGPGGIFLLCVGALALWVVTSTALNMHARLASLRGSPGARLVSQPRSYYGMLLAHVGVAVFIIGVTLVKGYESERDVRMAIGDSIAVGGYAFRFDGVENVTGPNYRAARGKVSVSREGREVMVLRPEKRIYNAQNMPMTEAAISTGLFGDLYVSLGEPVSNGAWSVRVYHKPFVTWIWGGCIIMALGGFLALSDRRYRRLARRESEVLPAGTQQPVAG